jgi:hypothetical protein
MALRYAMRSPELPKNISSTTTVTVNYLPLLRILSKVDRQMAAAT